MGREGRVGRETSRREEERRKGKGKGRGKWKKKERNETTYHLLRISWVGFKNSVFFCPFYDPLSYLPVVTVVTG